MFMLEDNEFECFTCGAIFKNRVFGISREWERVDYLETMPVVSVADSYGLECYCSERCQKARISEVMERERVPILRPGLGPIEVCSKCRGSVDMSQFHLTYLEDQVETDGFNATPIDVGYLAVLCRACAPSEESRTVARHASWECSPIGIDQVEHRNKAFVSAMR